jgi:hypothetical protein
MNTSIYQNIKLHFLSLIHLSKDAVHIYIGLTVFLIFVVIFKKSLSSLKSLVPVLIIAVVMEAFDLWDDFHSLGQCRWLASLHDIKNTLFWPFILVILVKLKFIKKV